MKLELELLGQAFEAELGTAATTRSLWGLGLLGAGLWAITPGGRKVVRSAAVKTMAAGMAAGDRVRQFVRRAPRDDAEGVADGNGVPAEA